MKFFARMQWTAPDTCEQAAQKITEFMKSQSSIPAQTTADSHTPGPWKVFQDCQRERSNPFDAQRFVATANAEWSGDNRDGNDYLISGSLICSTRDDENQAANARLLAAAPELLAIAQRWMTWATGPVVPIAIRMQLQEDTAAAISKATQL